MISLNQIGQTSYIQSTTNAIIEQIPNIDKARITETILVMAAMTDEVRTLKAGIAIATGNNALFVDLSGDRSNLDKCPYCKEMSALIKRIPGARRADEPDVYSIYCYSCKIKVKLSSTQFNKLL